MDALQSFIERFPEVRALLAQDNIITILESACAAVNDAYIGLGAQLPKDHVWNAAKIEHARAGATEAAGIAGRLGMNDAERQALRFLLFAHDIGRLVEARRQQFGMPRPPWHHGRDSVAVIRASTGYLPTQQPWFDTLLVAVEHHADRSTPELAQLGGDRAAWALTTLLRDLDKRVGFANAYRYTTDTAFMAAQAVANWPERRRVDPDWGTEMGRIDPPEMTWVFLDHKAIDRSRCRSYEAYMLQFLAWVFDIQHPELRALTCEEGGPDVVLAYLGRQLPSAEFCRIENAYRTFVG